MKTNILLTALTVFVYYLGYQQYKKDTHRTPTFSFKTESNSSPEKKGKGRKSNKFKKFYIHGVGDYEQSNLYFAKKIMKEEFDVETEISEPIVLSDYHLNEDGFLLVDKFEKLDQGGHHIFVTNHRLMLKDGRKIVGEESAGSIIVRDLSKTKSTLIHEFCHYLGLQHCKKTDCIMFHKEKGAKELCDYHKKRLKDVLN